MPLKQHDHPQYYADHRAAADAPFRTTKRTTIVTRCVIAVCVVVAAVAGVTYLSTGLDPRSPVVTMSGATGGVLLRDGSTSTPTREAFIARYPELMDISPADQTVQYEAYLLYLNGMTVTELDLYYHINDNGQQEGGGAGATSALINGGQQEGSGGLNVAILRGSNVQDVVEIVASASSSTGATGLADDVGDVPAMGGCPTSGTSPTVFTKNMPVTPDMIYSHLSFSERSYDKHLLGYPNQYCSLSFDDYGINCFWRICAEKCNRDPKCRTFTAYQDLKHQVMCYLHRDWLCNKGWRYEVITSARPRNEGQYHVSGVCRPEPGWYTDRSCSSF